MSRFVISGAFVIILMFCLASPSFADYEDSLLAYWKMDGNWNDSAHSYHGTPSATGLSFSSGLYGNAGTFNGSSGMLTVSGLDLTYTDLTVSVWVNIAGSDYDSILGNRPTGATYPFLLTIYDHTPMVYSSQLSSESYSGRTGISSDSWTFVTMTYKAGDTMTFYVDQGQPYSSAVGGTISNYYATSSIGADNSAGYANWFQGSMDNLAVWDRALSGAEVAAIFEMGIENFYDLGLTEFGNLTTAVANLNSAFGLPYTDWMTGKLAKLLYQGIKGQNPEDIILYNDHNWSYFPAGSIPDYDSHEFGEVWSVGEWTYMKIGDGVGGKGDGLGEEGDAVPEPSAMAVGGIAIGLLGLLKKMKRKEEKE